MNVNGRVSPSWAHPHLRGEHRAGTTAQLDEAGSSPPAWGTHVRVVLNRAGFGLIPTCVGNTCSRSHQQKRGRAHPHLRGEHIEPIVSAMAVVGSSPPAWGTLG